MSPLLRELCERLCCLPGVGPRGAQRMAMHLLTRDREGGRQLAECMEKAMRVIGHCRNCRALCEENLCAICSDERRDSSLLCVVESPADLVAVEQTGGYCGRYFVLLGRLSPIDGIGPEELGFPQLYGCLGDGVRELILATSATVEGEATAVFLAEQLRDLKLSISRISHGVPLGGELDFVDGGTLLHALNSRTGI